MKCSTPFSGTFTACGARLLLRRGTRGGELSEVEGACVGGGSSLVALGVGAPLADARSGMGACGRSRGGCRRQCLFRVEVVGEMPLLSCGLAG